MKVHVNIDQQGIAVNETFTGNTAEEIVGLMKARVAKELNFAMKMVVNGMSPLLFAQEVVKRYGDHAKKTLPVPQSCEDFLTLAQSEGFAKVDAT